MKCFCGSTCKPQCHDFLESLGCASVFLFKYLVFCRQQGHARPLISLHFLSRTGACPALTSPSESL